jgi:hypothetical protein
LILILNRFGKWRFDCDFKSYLGQNRLGIDSYHVENNKCLSFDQVFPDINNIEEKCLRFSRFNECSSFAQVFPDFGNIDGVVKAVDTD